jgi:DNA-binding SARP family transcriptional activator/tetratricopeptide (TPR) repeat protein
LSEPLPQPTHIKLLGRFEIADGVARLSDERLSRRRKSSWLIKLLALSPEHALNREQISETLWPELEPTAARNSLYKHLHFLRRAFRDEGSSRDIVSLAGAIVSLPAGVVVDIEEFRRAADVALDAGTDVVLYERALEFYGGQLLPGELYEPWTEPHREGLSSLRIQLVRRLSELYETRGEWLRAADLLRSVRDDSLDEEIVRSVMRVSELAGDRAAAIAEYERCRSALLRELGVEPSDETAALYRALVSRQPDAVTVAVAGRAETRLVGRDPEMSQLRRALADAMSGSGGVVLIHGEPGIGKTRLTQELLDYARMRDCQVGVGRCFGDEGAPPYHAWVEALRPLIPAADTGGLHTALGASAQEIVELFSELRGVFPAAPPAPVSPERARFRLFDGVNRLIRFISRRAPILLVIEDLHDADDSALLLLRSIARECAGQRVLLVATHRTAEAAKRPALREALSEIVRSGLKARIALAGFNEQEIGQYIRLTTGTDPARGVVREIARESGGNPLFAREYARLLLSGRDIRGVPETVQDIVLDRMESLSDDCVEVLRTAAVIGSRFEAWLLTRVARATRELAMNALGEAATAGIIRPTDDHLDGFEFTHDVIRKTLYSRLPYSRRGELHEAVGEALESLAERDKHLGELAHHFALAARAGGDAEKAIGYSVRAGEAARARFAWEEAVRYWETALQLMDQVRADPEQIAALLERLEDLIAGTGGDYEAGLQYLERALRLREQLGDDERAAQIHSRLGRALSTHVGDVRYARYMDLSRALDHYRAAEAVLSRGAERPAIVYFYVGQASAAFNAVRVNEALAASQRAMDVAERLGLEILWASAALLRGTSLKAAGRLGESKALLTRAYEIADRLTIPLVAYYAVTNIADWTEGYRAGSGELYRREMEKQRLAAAETHRTAIIEDLGCALCRNGRLDEAKQLASEVPDGFLTAMVRYCDGDWDGAEATWRQGFEMLAAVGHRSAYASRAHQLAALQLARGDVQEAERLLRDELAIGTEGGGTLIELRARIELALVCADAGRVDEAREHVVRARTIVDAGEQWGSQAGRVAMIEGAIAAAAGDAAHTAERFVAARRIFDAAELVWDEAELQLQWARAARRLGNASEAEEHVREAQAIYRRIGAGDRWLQRTLAAAAGVGSE